MITSSECKTNLDECQRQATAPDISLRRATSIMAICRAWIALSRDVAVYDSVVEAESGTDAEADAEAEAEVIAARLR